MSELGIHFLVLSPDWKPSYAERYAERLSGHGLDLVELPVLDPEALDWKATRSALERLGLRANFSLVLPETLDIVSRPEETEDFLKLALSTAAKAGGKMVTGVTYSKIGGMIPAMPTPKDRDTICKVMDKVAKTARGLDMRLGIEAVNRYETKYINNALQAKDIVERVGSHSLMVHLDSYHMNIEEKSLRQGIVDAGETLGYIHLSESNRGVPGQGTVDWTGMLEGLLEIGYAGPLVLESFAFMVEGLAGALAIWHPVAENPDDVIDVGIPFIKEKAEAVGYTI